MCDSEDRGRGGWVANSLVLMGLIVFVVLLLLGSSRVVIESFDCWEVRAQFGDMFGFANALFSGLAFAGVVWAILLQRRDLQIQSKSMELQRQEMELTRDELQRSADAHEETLRHIEQEYVEKAMERRRAATLITKTEKAEWTNSNQSGVRVTLKNLSVTVFRISASSSDSEEYTVKADSDVGVVYGDVFSIIIECANGEPLTLRDSCAFELYYIDIHGNVRSQTYVYDTSSSFAKCTRLGLTSISNAITYSDD